MSNQIFENLHMFQMYTFFRPKYQLKHKITDYFSISKCLILTSATGYLGQMRKANEKNSHL